MDGCIGGGCTLGVAPCTCVAQCTSPSCTAPQTAKCDPYTASGEICGDGIDNNCDGNVDEGCDLPSDDNCKTASKTGSDPILLSSRAALTTPFTDFAVAAVSRLSITRTYNSSDASVVLGTSPGIFGRGWHHEWESSIHCLGGGCTVSQGLAQGLKFSRSESVVVGGETWDIYRAYADQVMHYETRSLLVRKPSGVWMLFTPDGREMHFQNDASCCQTDDRRCKDPRLGGQARLVKVVDATSNAVTAEYDRAAGVLLRLRDALGHSLELRSAQACGPELATELWYDGSRFVTYDWWPGTDNLLKSATDAEGKVFRSYVYFPNSWGRLQAVQDEKGTNVAEFSYDTQWRATGVIDAESSVSVNYNPPSGGGIQVTEYFQGPSGPTSAASLRPLDRNGNVTSVSDNCACGPARTLTWTSGRLTCTADAQGHVTYQVFDAQGRPTRRVEYQGSCPTSPAGIPNPLPADARDEQRAYGLVREIATGVTLELDRPTSVTRPSTLGTSTAGETFDYDQTAKGGDPVDYSCAPTALPVGSVVCRHTRGGYVSGTSGPEQERQVTWFSYDEAGRLVRSYGPLSLDHPGTADVAPVEERTYWPDSETLPRRGRLWQVKRYANLATAPLVTTYDYDLFGPFQVTAPNGSVTTIIKDGRGRPTFVGIPASVRETRYQDGLLPRLQIMPTGAVIRYGYDTKGRLKTVEYLTGDPDQGAVTVRWTEEYRYDAAGNRVHAERRDQAGAVKWKQDRAFDVQHRVVQETSPVSPSPFRTWSYDASGFLSGVKDEEARETDYTPDGLGRPTKVTRTGLAGDGVTPVSLDVAVYHYEPSADTLGWVNDGNARMTYYWHDDFGRLARLSSLTLQKGGDVFFTYDARSNVLKREDSYVTVSYTYDGLDRVLGMSATNSADGSSVSYTFTYDEAGTPQQPTNGAGRLTTVTEPGRTVKLAYWPSGRLKSETVTENGVATPLVTGYEYDADGAVWKVTYPSGLKVRYDRDQATREVTRVVDDTTGQAYGDFVQHAPGGPVTSLTFGNGKTLSQTLDLRYQPTAVASGPLLLGYGVTPAGDVKRIDDSSQVLSGCYRNTFREFKYDFLDRLTASPGWLSYGYDGGGNRTSEAVEGAAATYAYAAGTDRVSKEIVSGVARYAFGYDRQANLSAIGKYDATGTSIQSAVCLRHDALGRMVLYGTRSASGVSPDATICTSDAEVTSAVARFRYDARNRRVARQDTATGSWIYTISDPSGSPLSEFSLVAGSWVKVRDYVWLDGRPLVQIEYPTSTTTYGYYLHLDHIGLPRAMTNQSGQLVWNTFPRPYGDIAEKAATDPLSGRVVVTNLRLPGQYDERLLGSLGLQGPYYNWNRWYLPGVGRYLQLDPLASGGQFNVPYGADWYGYAEQNPLVYVDRDGRKGVPPGVWTGTGILGFVGGAIVGVLIPTRTGGDPCENSPGGCVNPPRPQPPPTPPDQCLKPCTCTCLGSADPNWYPEDPHHGDRYVGKQPHKAECRAECQYRGFSDSQCI